MSVILISKTNEKVLLTKSLDIGQTAYDSLPESIGELILYLKEGEESKIDITLDYFEETEKDQDFLKTLKESLPEDSTEEYPFTLHISLKTIIENDDLFHDKTVLKKKIFSSFDTCSEKSIFLHIMQNSMRKKKHLK